MKELIKNYIIESIMGEEIDIDDATSLFEEGIIDSLGQVKLISFLEKKFSIAIDPGEITIDNFGTKERRKNIKLKDSKPVTLKRGMELITAEGRELIETIEIDWHQDPDQYVYTLICDGSHVCVVNGNLVSAWARDDDFDYNTWSPKVSHKVAA